MKKKILTCVAFFGVTYAQSTFAILPDLRSTSVDLTFKVEIKKKQCVVSVDNMTPNKPLDLGKIQKKVGQKGAVIPLRFQFTKCDGPQHVQSIEYTRDMRGSGHSDSKPYVTTNFPDDVRVYLYRDERATMPFNGKSFGHDGWKITNDWVDVCYLQAQILEGSKLPETLKGDFVGEAQFTVTYL